MDYKIITDKQARHILEKYWAGDSSLAEEAALRSYFQSAQIPDDLLSLRPMFLYFRSEKGLACEETSVLNLEKTPTHIIPMWKTWGMSIAASVILVVASISTLHYISTNPTSIPAREETKTMASLSAAEKKAYEETKAALLLISSKLNKGKEKAVSGLKHISK